MHSHPQKVILYSVLIGCTAQIKFHKLEGDRVHTRSGLYTIAFPIRQICTANECAVHDHLPSWRHARARTRTRWNGPFRIGPIACLISSVTSFLHHFSESGLSHLLSPLCPSSSFRTAARTTIFHVRKLHHRPLCAALVCLPFCYRRLLFPSSLFLSLG